MGAKVGWGGLEKDLWLGAELMGEMCAGSGAAPSQRHVLLLKWGREAWGSRRGEGVAQGVGVGQKSHPPPNPRMPKGSNPLPAMEEAGGG